MKTSVASQHFRYRLILPLPAFIAVSYFIFLIVFLRYAFTKSNKAAVWQTHTKGMDRV